MERIYKACYLSNPERKYQNGMVCDPENTKTWLWEFKVLEEFSNGNMRGRLIHKFTHELVKSSDKTLVPVQDWLKNTKGYISFDCFTILPITRIYILPDDTLEFVLGNPL